MNPQPLRITQPVIFRLHLNKHDLFFLRIPNQQVRNPSAPLLVLLRQDLADCRQCLAAETLRDLDQIL